MCQTQLAKATCAGYSRQVQHCIPKQCCCCCCEVQRRLLQVSPVARGITCACQDQITCSINEHPPQHGPGHGRRTCQLEAVPNVLCRLCTCKVRHIIRPNRVVAGMCLYAVSYTVTICIDTATVGKHSLDIFMCQGTPNSPHPCHLALRVSWGLRLQRQCTSKR
jgi:hypothetical protein